jgi:hypothetical protein
MKKTSFGLLSVTLLTIVSAMVFSAAFHAVPVEAQTSAVTGEIVNPLVGTNDFAFNSSVYPVNSTFTLDFYIANVNDMVAWQIYISWNNTMINFDTAWIPGVNSPGSNVFTEAFNEGATPIVPTPDVEYDTTTNTGYLYYGAANHYQPANNHMIAVNVVGLGLLCSVNFTIQVSATGANVLSSTINNYGLSADLPDYSCVIDPSGNETQISAEPATLEIYGSQALIPEFTPWMIMPFFIVATLLAVLVYRRKNKWPK